MFVHIYRLQAEHERLERDGPLAYYSEWVKAWKKDTSRDAVQKHFEETGEDEVTQLIEMFSHQTDREYRIMMGTDIRIKRDPLAMRMREDLIKQSMHLKAYEFIFILAFVRAWKSREREQNAYCSLRESSKLLFKSFPIFYPRDNIVGHAKS